MNPDELMERADLYRLAGRSVFAAKLVGGELVLVDTDEERCVARIPAFGGWTERWRDAMFRLSGTFAERLEVLGEVRAETWMEFTDAVEVELNEEENSDKAEIMADLEQMSSESGDSLEQSYATVVRDTEKTVRERWAQITAVAEALKERRRLEGEEVARLIEGEAGEDSG